jgi:hypothetical protein
MAAAVGMLALQWLLATYNTIETIPTASSSGWSPRAGHRGVGRAGYHPGKLKDKLPSGKSAFITARVDPVWRKSSSRRRRHRCLSAGCPDHPVLDHPRDVHLIWIFGAGWRIARDLAD